MTANLSRSIGFIIATVISIALAVFVATWWLAIAIACLAIATIFWLQDRAYHTIDRPFRRIAHPAGPPRREETRSAAPARRGGTSRLEGHLLATRRPARTHGNFRLNRRMR